MVSLTSVYTIFKITVTSALHRTFIYTSRRLLELCWFVLLFRLGITDRKTISGALEIYTDVSNMLDNVGCEIFFKDFNNKLFAEYSRRFSLKIT